MVVAIDGPAGVGKSSIAEMIAKELNYFHLNSGNFYRAITFKVIEESIDPDDDVKIIALAKSLKVEIKNENFFVNNVNIDDELHSSDVDKLVGKISSIVEIRNIVNNMIRKIGDTLDLVIEGRDITTVVFPDAEAKFYFDADAKVRAKRRFDQGLSDLSLEEITQSILERDEIDRNKGVGSLKISNSAEYIDTTYLTIGGVCAKVFTKINELIGTGRIEQVMTEMDAKADQTNLQEEYLKALDTMEEGQLVDGQVIHIDSDHVFIDVGYKSEGRIPLNEFAGKTPELGDIVSVVIVKKEGRHGELVVSKKKADLKVVWKELKNAFNDGTPVKGTIVKSIKGGFEVDLGGDVIAFMPISKADIVKVDKPEKYIGIESDFSLEKLYGEKKANVVVSRRKLLEERMEANRKEFFETKKEGDIVKGKVKSFTSFGAFIDLGGFDGLLHINDMSWGHVSRPKDFVKKNDEVELKIIRLDEAEKRINLSLKHFTEDPWVTFQDKFHPGDVISGKVTKLTDFGAFIEIVPGVEGLAHISELSWVKRVKHPKELFSIGDPVDAMILDFDVEEGRISLGVKHVLPNPWDDIIDRYPCGEKHELEVKKVTNAGAFLEVEEGIDGFLHVEDLTWDNKTPKPSAVFTVGEKMECCIVGIDADSRRIRLGVKQLHNNPWEDFANNHPIGSIIEGEVTNKAEFGVFVSLGNNIEGLIHKSNLATSKEVSYEDALEAVNKGDKLKAAVTDVNIFKQKVSLSVREVTMHEERKEISKYLDGETQDDGTYTLGDLLK
ncbi:30S ribosomal protein S1 [Thiospirochaeta perfilievii]|uniref:Cytidylate kinase n=1 Tax=Thiospirochaeta perfilievii TaxID=252967 RepID=A0A5C1Q6U6_9SPIO|nr:30S ribosomal protein S1 [Thiospirochaeta perfilievii]QEN03211.1 30S ribosomal protein S1 [Thiospirochaeta perfilievii]